MVQKTAGVRVDIAVFGVIVKQAPLEKYALSQVHDLVDVIHNLEARHAFLKKVKYQVTVNNVKVDKNRRLSSGDKITIQPKTNARI